MNPALLSTALFVAETKVSFSVFYHIHVQKNCKQMPCQLKSFHFSSFCPHHSIIIYSNIKKVQREGEGERPGRSLCRWGIPVNSGPPPSTNSGEKKAQSFLLKPRLIHWRRTGEEGGVGSNSHPTSHPLRGAFHWTVCSPIIKQDRLLKNQNPHHVLSKTG